MIVWGGGEGKEHSCHLYLYHLKGTILFGKTCEEEGIPLKRKKMRKTKHFCCVNLLSSLNFVFPLLGLLFSMSKGAFSGQEIVFNSNVLTREKGPPNRGPLCTRHCFQLKCTNEKAP
jgi:hypothetical protein